MSGPGLRGRLRGRLRSGARRVALDVVAARETAGSRLATAWSTPRVHLVYLHAVAPDQEDRFRTLLRDWSAHHTFIGYGEAVRRIETGDIDRPYLAFSFDDGFASNVRTAGLLTEFGVTGCFFVPTDFIGTPTVERARALFGYAAGIDEPAMTWDDLDALAAAGHEIGNHTRSHRQLSKLGDAELADEIGTAAEVLRERFGAEPHFAWPFGRFTHMSAEAARLVFDLGHRSCASAVRGAHAGSGGSRPCLRREHIATGWPERHSHAFLARGARAAGRASWPDGWRV